MIKKIRNSKLVFCITLTLFLISNTFLFPVMPVCAQPRTGDIEIDFKGRTDDREDVLLSGAKFEIFPIQYMDNGGMVWRDEFAKCGISLDDTSSEARVEQAKALFDYAKANNITGIIHETDGNGHTHFLDLAEGMYLLAEIGDVENGVDTFDSAPFLVKIPSEVSGKFEYDVNVEPKAEWVSHDGEPVGPGEPENPPKDNPDEPENPPKDQPDNPPNSTPTQTPTPSNTHNPIQKIVNTVKTGDATNVLLLIGVAVTSLGVIILSIRKKRNIKQ